MTYRVNIGCGMSPTEGWLNYDNSLSLRASKLPGWFIRFVRRVGVITEATFAYICFSRNSAIRFCDATKRIPLPDGSVEVLYSSHMLEHLDNQEAELFLKEGYRVLSKDGVIRIAVPGLSQKINQYMMDNDADLFMQSLHTCQSKPKALFARLKLTVAGLRHHHWMYDEQSLCRLLESLGYRNAIALPPGKTRIHNPGPLNLSERIEESIYVEAIK